MYNSLYSILLPIIEAKAAGILSLQQKDGKKAEIIISDGVIAGCRNGELSGERAAKMVAKWLHVEHDFLEGNIPADTPETDLDGKSYIQYLKKIHLIVSQVAELVPHGGVRLKMTASDYRGEITLKNNELKVVAQLNGKKTIDRVRREAGVSEFDLVYTIYKYHHLGMIKMVGSHEVMEKTERASLLKSIDEKLSDIVGPAAAIITKEAFRTIGGDEAYLSWRDAGKLTDAIAGHLDGEEKQVFLDWWLKNPDRRRTLDY